MKSTPLSTPLAGFKSSANVTLENLLPFTTDHWLTETCMEIGIDLIEVIQ
jgi:hypothetical protein